MHPNASRGGQGVESVLELGRTGGPRHPHQAGAGGHYPGRHEAAVGAVMGREQDHGEMDEDGHRVGGLLALQVVGVDASPIHQRSRLAMRTSQRW